MRGTICLRSQEGHGTGRHFSTIPILINLEKPTSYQELPGSLGIPPHPMQLIVAGSYILALVSVRKLYALRPHF